MTFNISARTRFASPSGTASYSAGNVTVGAVADQVLFVQVLHKEAAVGVTTNSVTWGGTPLTKVSEAITDAEFGLTTSLWALANPTAGTRALVASSSVSTDWILQAWTVDGVDITSGLTSAINAQNSFMTTTDGPSASASVTTNAANCLLMDCMMVNTASATLSEANGQTNMEAEQYSGGLQWTYRIGRKDAASAGAYTMGYTASPNFGRVCLTVVALKPAGGAVTLGDLTFTQTTANRVPGEDVSWSITGKAVGSTVAVDWGGGVTASTTSTTLTLTGGFATAGTKTPVSVTETLAGATNTPHTSPTFNTTILNRLKVACIGSSTMDFFFGTLMTTTEVAGAQVYATNNGTTFTQLTTYNGAGKGPGSVALGNQLAALYGSGYRIDLFHVALGGTAVGDNSTGWSTKAGPATGNYPVALAAMLAAGGVDAVLMFIGNDAVAKQVTSQTLHLTNLRLVVSNFRTDLSAPNLKFFIGINHRLTSPTSDDAAIGPHMARCRAAEMRLSDDPNVYIAFTGIDQTMYDDKHLSEGKNGGSATVGRRAAYAIHNVLAGGTRHVSMPRPGTPVYPVGTAGEFVEIPFTGCGSYELVGKGGSQSNLTGTWRVFANGVEITGLSDQPFISGANKVAWKIGAGRAAPITVMIGEDDNLDINNWLSLNCPAVPQP